MTKKWYVIHVYSGQEKKVAAAIEEQVMKHDLNEYIEEVLVPTQEVIQVRKGKKVPVQKNFFPGYVLIKMEMSDEAWHKVTNLAKVTAFLGGKTRPTAISDKEADRILAQVRDGVDKGKPVLEFEVGEQVRVCDGPFTSFNGFIEEIDEEKARLKVSVSIFGRATPVDLDYSQVEKV